MPFVTVNGNRFWIQPKEIRKDFARNTFFVKKGKRIFIEPSSPDFRTDVARRTFGEDKPTASQIRAASVQQKREIAKTRGQVWSADHIARQRLMDRANRAKSEADALKFAARSSDPSGLTRAELDRAHEMFVHKGRRFQ